MMDFTYVPEPANQKQQQTMFMVWGEEKGVVQAGPVCLGGCKL